MTRRNLILASAVAVVLIAGGVLATLALTGDDTTPKAASGRTTGSTPSVTTSAVSRPSLPSGSGTDTRFGRSAVTETAARSTVVEYLNNVNGKDKDAAGLLICKANYDSWKAHADSADTDFNFTVSKALFRSSDRDPDSNGLITHYTLTFDDDTSTDIDFTVVDEDGPKICGIKSS